MGFGRTPRGSQLFPQKNKYPQLDVEDIATFIDQGSVAIQYWKATTCPCATPQTGQPNIVCASCRGLGWAYSAAEAEAEYQRALVHNRRSSKLNEAGGFVTKGYASITFKQGIVPGDGDLVQVCADREVVNDEYHVCGSQLTDGSTAETLRFRDVHCVESVKVWDEANRRVVALAAADWSFDAAQRRVIFAAPVYGLRYSLRYQARPEYVVMGETSKPLMRAGHDDELPEPYRTRVDIVYPYNVMATRLDRAILQRLRGAADFGATPTTFSNTSGRGPFVG